MIKVLTVVGARPQFVKAAPVRKALELAGHIEYLVHTGQHYDYAMSQIFFDEMGIRQPDINLGVGSGAHGRQTGEMLILLEGVIEKQKPDVVLVYGDTNSTLAGALAAAKLNVPVAHVEAGLRSFNREMPEEHNRVLTDHCADLLLCPTQTAIDNLAHEGIANNAHLVGDTMYDAVLQFAELARVRSSILTNLGLESKEYLLATVHRPYNTDNPKNLHSILSALIDSNEVVVFPVHPRTRARINSILNDFPDILRHENLKITEPIGYLDMLSLEQHARIILTDSGGVQKEAYFFAVPCVTLRTETEWVETVESGWNRVVGSDRERILWGISSPFKLRTHDLLYGDGAAAKKIVQILDTKLRNTHR